jgi:hypothetical protein
MVEKNNEIKELQDKIKDLESKSVTHENKLFDLGSDFENVKMNS